MSVCVCSYVFFWEGTVGEEESVVMEFWQGDLLPDTCRVSNWRCPNSPSLAGQGKEEGRARVKITPKPITSRKKYKTPPSLLLCLPIVFHAQSLSILVITGRHNGTPFLHCSESGSSSGDENVSRVRRGGRGGRRKGRVGWVVPCLAVVSGLWAFELCQISTKVIALIIFYIIEIQHPTYILNFKLDGL